MREISAAMVDNVITEFLAQIEEEAGIAGGGDETRRFLNQFMEKDQVNQLMEDVEAKGRSVWTALNDVADTDTLLLPIHFTAPTVGRVTGDGDDHFHYRYKRD